MWLSIRQKDCHHLQNTITNFKPTQSNTNWCSRQSFSCFRELPRANVGYRVFTMLPSVIACYCMSLHMFACCSELSRVLVGHHALILVFAYHRIIPQNLLSCPLSSWVVACFRIFSIFVCFRAFSGVLVAYRSFPNHKWYPIGASIHYETLIKKLGQRNLTWTFWWVFDFCSRYIQGLFIGYTILT